MAQVVLVVRLPLPAHVVDMTDARCGSIGAEVPKDEEMTSVDDPRNYTKDQGQRIDEAVAYSTKGQETEQVTALDGNRTSHFDEAVGTQHFDGGRQNSWRHEGREGRECLEDHDWTPKVVV